MHEVARELIVDQRERELREAIAPLQLLTERERNILLEVFSTQSRGENELTISAVLPPESDALAELVKAVAAKIPGLPPKIAITVAALVGLIHMWYRTQKNELPVPSDAIEQLAMASGRPEFASTARGFVDRLIDGAITDKGMTPAAFGVGATALAHESSGDDT